MKPGRKPKDQINEKGQWEPTEIQGKAIELLFNTDMSNTAIIKKLQIAEPTFYSWFKNENFVAYIEKRRAMQFSSVMPRVDNSLVNRALCGGKDCVSAIRTIYEKRGEINGPENKQPITIVFQALVNGQIKRPTIKAEEVQNGSDNLILPKRETE